MPDLFFSPFLALCLFTSLPPVAYTRSQSTHHRLIAIRVTCICYSCFCGPHTHAYAQFPTAHVGCRRRPVAHRVARECHCRGSGGKSGGAGSRQVRIDKQQRHTAEQRVCVLCCSCDDVFVYSSFCSSRWALTSLVRGRIGRDDTRHLKTLVPFASLRVVMLAQSEMAHRQ